MGVLRCGHDRFFYWMHETRRGGASWLCVFGIWLQRPTGVTSPDSADTTFKGGEQHLSPEQHKEHKCHLVSVVKPKTQVHWCSLGGPRHTKREGAAWLRCSACFFSFSNNDRRLLSICPDAAVCCRLVEQAQVRYNFIRFVTEILWTEILFGLRFFLHPWAAHLRKRRGHINTYKTYTQTRRVLSLT